MKRLFAAIRIRPDRDFLLRFREMKSRMRSARIKWVEEENIHVTLKFFGETGEEKIPEIVKVLENIASGTRPFSFSLKSVGIFGSSWQPRVVWIGIDPYRDLVEVMERFRKELAEIGYEPDRQNLVPHLTAGRIREVTDRPRFQETLEHFRDLSSAAYPVREFHLFESILRKEGPLYRVLNTFPLKKE